MPTEARIPDFVPPSFADPRSGRIVLLADDLTGACDAGAAFLRAGRSVRVWFGTSVRVFNPGIRPGIQHQFARAFGPPRGPRGHSPARLLAAIPIRSFSKKSTPPRAVRLPPSCSPRTARLELAPSCSLPLFPQLVARFSDGILEIEDAAGQHAQIRLEQPLSAHGSQPHLPRLPRPRTRARALDPGKTILICDSATQADLDALAKAANSLPGLLYAGSAGLAQALAGLIPARPMAALVPPAERTLLIAGSPHPVTKLQLEELDSGSRDDVRVLQPQCHFSAAGRIRSAFRSSRSPGTHPYRRRNGAACRSGSRRPLFYSPGRVRAGHSVGRHAGRRCARMHRRHQVRRLRLANGIQ